MENFEIDTRGNPQLLEMDHRKPDKKKKKKTKSYLDDL